MATFSTKPPVHPNCRCVLSPVTIFDEGDTERPYKYKDPETGKMKYGKTTSKERYRNWFDRQDASFQKEILGLKKYSLYKAGKLDFKDYADIRNNKIYTIKYLERKYNSELNGMKK